MTIGITALVLNAAYAEAIILSVIMLSVIMLSDITVSLIMPNVIMPSVILPHVVVPYLNVCLTFYSNYCSMTNENVKHQSLNEMSQLIPTMFCNL